VSARLVTSFLFLLSNWLYQVNSRIGTRKTASPAYRLVPHLQRETHLSGRGTTSFRPCAGIASPSATKCQWIYLGGLYLTTACFVLLGWSGLVQIDWKTKFDQSVGLFAERDIKKLATDTLVSDIDEYDSIDTAVWCDTLIYSTKHRPALHLICVPDTISLCLISRFHGYDNVSHPLHWRHC
jgi:hypothetical protein